MKTKQQAIQEAYGFLNDLIDENGWTFYRVDEGGESGIEPTEDCEIKSNIDGVIEWRPKSLQGIEKNNGWIKIESENDLPKDLEVCNFIPCNYKNEAFIGFIKNDEVYFIDYSIVFNEDYIKLNSWLKSQITHYQPIENPKPPIY
jgi:hypothetical protein